MLPVCILGVVVSDAFQLPGDVVLTPSWSWHGHANESDATSYWIDFLDIPFVHLTEAMFFADRLKDLGLTDDQPLLIYVGRLDGDDAPRAGDGGTHRGIGAGTRAVAV